MTKDENGNEIYKDDADALVHKMGRAGMEHFGAKGDDRMTLAQLEAFRAATFAMFRTAQSYLGGLATDLTEDANNDRLDGRCEGESAEAVASRSK